MISGATRGDGGPYIVSHLLTQGMSGIEPGANDEAVISGRRGLLADGLDGMVREMVARGAHGRTDRPLIHVHADPPPGRDWSAAEWQRFWSLYETEFDLTDRPFSEVTHRKHGREHRHRLYLAVRADGTVVNLSHEYARREKLSRIVEYETRAPFVLGRHNRAVHQRLMREGREDVAAAMAGAGLLEASRPEALSPGARQQAERAGMDTLAVDAAVLAAWQASDNGASLVTALTAAGLHLVAGTKEVLVADRDGRLHPNPLGKLLGRVSKAAGLDRVAAGEVRARLAGVAILKHRDDVIAGDHDGVRKDEHDRRRAGSSERDGEAGEAEAGRRVGDDLADLRGDDRGCEHRLPPSAAGRAGRGIQDTAGDRPADRDRRVTGTERAAALRDRGDAGRVGRALGRGGTNEIRLLTARLRLGPDSAASVSTCTIRLADGVPDRKGRRAAWIAVQLRQAYDTGWLPPSVADRIVRVKVDEQAKAVVITLLSGTVLVDRRDRIDVVGRTDDMAVEELAEAVLRRGWDAVLVEGEPEFRVAVARRLAALRPPVRVVDNPLSEYEIAEILDADSPALPLAPSRLALAPRRGRPQGGGGREALPGGNGHGMG